MLIEETTKTDSDNMNECLLCLECPTIPGPKFLGLFSEEGRQLNMGSIINKYFRLKTCRNSGETQTICMDCWKVVRDFHFLYTKVEEVHKHLEVKTIEINDPDVVMLKWEEVPLPIVQEPVIGPICLSNNPFDSEVKVEVNDLYLLPQIEIIETSSDMPTTTKGIRRSHNAGCDQSPKTNQSKKERFIVPNRDVDDDDDNNFDVYDVTKDVASDDILGAEQLKKSYLSSTLDVLVSKFILNKDAKTRRDRSIKIGTKMSKNDKRVSKKYQKLVDTIQNEQDYAEENLCPTAQKTCDMPSIKTDQSSDKLFDKVDEITNNPVAYTFSDIAIEPATVDKDGSAFANAIADEVYTDNDVVMLKCEETPVALVQEPIMRQTCLSDNPFDLEIKVEVSDLDLLPKIEIIENAPVMPTITEVSLRSHSAGCDQIPKTNQSKKEHFPAHDGDNNENGFYVNATEDATSENILATEQFKLSSTWDRLCKMSAETAKCDNGVSNKYQKEIDIIQNEHDYAAKSSCSTAQIKTELLTDEMIVKADEITNNTVAYTVADIAIERTTVDEAGAAVGNDIVNKDVDNDNYNDNDCAVESSDDSSNSESESGDNPAASEWPPDSDPKSANFAAVVKKNHLTPENYKKDEKPSVKRIRKPKEETAARIAQQAEYDNIIKKFFEKIQCPKCQLYVPTFRDIRPHFRDEHNSLHSYVECCGFRFAVRKTLAEHIMIHNNPEYFKCKTCDKICRNSKQLEVHEQSHLQGAVQCEICLKTLSSMEYLKFHMLTHMPRELYKFECPECKKRYATRKRLNSHRQYHNPAPDLVCDICGKILLTRNSLDAHKKVVHGPKRKKVPEQCVYCLNWYSTRSSLQTHVLNMHVHADDEHRCDICGFVSSSRDGVKKHKRVKHIAAKRHICGVCDKAFKIPVALKEHMAIHTGIDLYKCDYCAVTFKSKSCRSSHCKRHHPKEYISNIKVRPRPTPIVSEVNILEEDIEF